MMQAYTASFSDFYAANQKLFLGAPHANKHPCRSTEKIAILQFEHQCDKIDENKNHIRASHKNLRRKTYSSLKKCVSGQK